MYWRFGESKQKIQRKGGERKMNTMLKKVAIILAITLTLTSFCGYQQAYAFNVWEDVRTVISSTIDSLGRYTARNQMIVSTGVDLENQPYVSLQTLEYELKDGFVTDRITKRTNYNLSTSAEVGLSGVNTTGDASTIKASIEAKKGTLNSSNNPFSYSKQEINYSYDAAGVLTGATGTETLDGKEAPWDQYTDKNNPTHVLTRVKNTDGTIYFYYDDPVTNTKTAVAANNVTTTPKEGSKYSTELGVIQLTFALINGQAEITKREGKIVYRDSTGAEQFTREMKTTNKYDERGKNIDSYSWSTDTYPETYKYNNAAGAQMDTNTHLFNAQFIHTQNEYNADGSLKSVTGTGYGWGLSNTGAGYRVFTSNIRVTYQITNGVAREVRREINAYYVPAENAPSQVDPEGSGMVIGVFDIHTDEVRGGSNVGAYNEYKYFVVQTADGKVYLLRALVHAGDGNDTTNNPLIPNSMTVSTIGAGSKISFVGVTLGNDTPVYNRIWRATSITLQP